MASRIITQLISDISGAEILNGEGEKVEFAYRGVNYVIDLTADEASDFDAAMAHWTGHATQRGGGRKRGERTRNGNDAKAIRQWARENGLDVPERGRIPAEVRSKYEAAN